MNFTTSRTLGVVIRLLAIAAGTLLAMVLFRAVALADGSATKAAVTAPINAANPNVAACGINLNAAGATNQSSTCSPVKQDSNSAPTTSTANANSGPILSGPVAPIAANPTANTASASVDVQSPQRTNIAAPTGQGTTPQADTHSHALISAPVNAANPNVNVTGANANVLGNSTQSTSAAPVTQSSAPASGSSAPGAPSSRLRSAPRIRMSMFAG